MVVQFTPEYSEKCNLCVFHCNITEENLVCQDAKNKDEFISMLSNDISYLEEYPELYNIMSKKEYEVI